jgi:hypothetical protein
MADAEKGLLVRRIEIMPSSKSYVIPGCVVSIFIKLSWYLITYENSKKKIPMKIHMN